MHELDSTSPAAILKIDVMAKVKREETASYQFTLILAGIKDLTPDVTC